MEVHSYSVMSNHLHVVVRTLPQQVSGWDDEHVARRWLSLFPGRGGRPGHPPEDDAIQTLCRDRPKLASCRERLADLSWFMRCLNEPIARRANREDECTGRQVRSGKRRSLSPHLRPVLERLDLDVERWVENVECFGGLFLRVAGKLRRLRERAQAIGQSSVHGHAGARRLYARAG